MKAEVGDYIVTGKHSHRGRVYKKHAECPEGSEWITMQSIPVTDEELKEPWYSVLVKGGGSVCIAERDIVKKEEPYVLNNDPYEEDYFGDKRVKELV